MAISAIKPVVVTPPRSGDSWDPVPARRPTDPPSHWSDRKLIEQVGKHFNEFGGGDEYVNFNELKQAAGLLPSDKTFSAEAQAVATEILDRPKLLRKLDIGVYRGGPGKEDERFDMDNVNHLKKKPAFRLAPNYHSFYN